MSNRRRLALPALVALVVVFAACSSSGGSGGADATTTSQAPDASTSSSTSTSVPGGATTTTTVAAGDAILAALVLPTSPGGLPQTPDRVADTGPVNLAKAAQDAVLPGAAKALSDAGFVAGWERSWAAGNGQENLFLYRFKTPEGAAQFATNRVAMLETDSFSTVALKEFPVLLGGATGVHGESDDSSFAAVMVAKGNFTIEATATDASNKDLSADAVALATAQYNRLP